jgi:hypothetical protein
MEETALFDERWGRYRTCILCYNIRRGVFPCGFYWGGLWDMIEDCFFNSCDCEDDCDCNEWFKPPTHPIEVTP